MINFSAFKLGEINLNCSFRRNMKAFYQSKKPNYPHIYTLQLHQTVKWTSDKKAVFNGFIWLYLVLAMTQNPK